MFVTEQTTESLLASVGESASRAGVRFESEVIGHSREGRALHLISLGNGSRVGSIVAGAHADEPCGPRAAFEIAQRFVAAPSWARVRDEWTLDIVPQCNPDGAEKNRVWFADEVSLEEYLRFAVRELPGDDIEFGYPAVAELADAGALSSVRPENVAIARALAARGVLRFHASLHGMSFAQGAWWLVGREWAGRCAGLMMRLRALAMDRMMPLHDLDRNGEKGFTRIAPGFCTTPRGDAMRAHFELLGDDATARLFRLSSMEFAAELGDDVLCLVTEMPLFRVVAGGDPWPSPDAPPPTSPTSYEQLRGRLPEMRAGVTAGDSSDMEIAIADFGITAVPARLHTDLIAETIRIALEFRAEGD